VSSCYFKRPEKLPIVRRMTISRRLALLLLLTLAFSGAPVDPADATDGWSVLRMPGKPVTDFAEGPDGVITVTAANSVGFLFRDASKVARAGRYLAWRWRVDVMPPPTDLAMKGMDDRPLAVHVWFAETDGSSADWSLRDRLGAWLQNAPLPGKMLTYVWGGVGKRGDRFRNPYREAGGQIVVLQAGDSPNGQWLNETVDIAADFEAAFGTPPPPPAYVAISADTDDKGGISKGAVADMVFRAAP
jgi:hypothetical protein